MRPARRPRSFQLSIPSIGSVKSGKAQDRTLQNRRRETGDKRPEASLAMHGGELKVSEAFNPEAPRLTWHANGSTSTSISTWYGIPFDT